jgi:hypothetical protein
MPNAVGARVDVENVNGVLQWRVNYISNGGWQSAYAGQVSTDTWYCVEVKLVLGSGNGETLLYINGAELITKTGLTNTAAGSSVRYFAMGVDDELGSNNLNVFFDAVAVAKGYIGLLSPSPSATPTATASPTPTASVTPSSTPKPTPTPTSPPTDNETIIPAPIQASWIANDGTVYAGMTNTVYKSQNYGVTWEPLITFSGTDTEFALVYVNKLGYVFVVPTPDADVNSLGVWRSVDGGETWKRVLVMRAGCTSMSMSEDADGNLYLGVYTVWATGNASICKSVDGGAHWTTVYYDSDARHVHCVEVDLANGYVYATVGDQRVWPWYTSYVIRSTDGGASWRVLLSLPQMLAVAALDEVAANGSLVPAARVFATDYDNGQIYRTTDDANFELVLDMGTQCYGYWIRQNMLNGNIYASFVAGEQPTNWMAAIYLSTNYGRTWTPIHVYNVHTPYYGSGYASNFQDGYMYYSLMLDSGLQDGRKIYPIWDAFSVGVAAGWSVLGWGGLAAWMAWAMLVERRKIVHKSLMLRVK